MYVLQTDCKWMDLETVIRSEGNQKNKYRILTHICGIQKNRRTYLQSRNRDTDAEKKRTDTKGEGGGGGMGWEIGTDVCTLLSMKQLTVEGLLFSIG